MGDEHWALRLYEVHDTFVPLHLWLNYARDLAVFRGVRLQRVVLIARSGSTFKTIAERPSGELEALVEIAVLLAALPELYGGAVQDQGNTGRQGSV